MSHFEIGEHDFLLDGEPFRVLSGAIHYFRVHPDHWADRIRKARLMGLNTIETYVAWNLHSPEPGSWDTSGRLDLARFLRTVADEGMYAIVRPGPYICAEFDNGGLPTWLFTDPGVGVRRGEQRYLDAVGTYLDRVDEIVRPLQIDQGGPVILMQVENEYGAYGDDGDYLRFLMDRMRAGGIEVPLTTVDQPRDLAKGSIPELHMTASFGSRSRERMATLRAHQTTGPLMSSEYWDGWFDSWGDYHHTTSAADSAADLDELLSLGASVNLYMFHGGTNFGLTSGANDRGVFKPIVTSYDYDAPLDEAGRPTEKYWAYRAVLAKHGEVPDEVPEDADPAPVDEVPLTGRLRFLDAVDAQPAYATRALPSFGELRHDAAILVHSTRLTLPEGGILTVGEVRDRVQIIVDGQCVGVLSREWAQTTWALPPVERELVLVVESMGRVNYGPRIGEDKGLIGGVRIDGVAVEGWSTRALSETDLGRVARSAAQGTAAAGGAIAGLTLAHARFEVDAISDRFLDTTGWGKGIAWVNGFCLGRYWSRPPQRTLYVPGPVLHAGTNELTILELDGAPVPVVRFVADADLGPLET
ncbi:beta-galactosidase family protein [Homoserinibacter sp. GY 40078]|uniref:glycoside hydrolase family 35 protein n=1 Tax=Homoserinibacter sp. GY 40078 TaxID=2603275 RepID=UPI0011C9819B|nr:beta-galactosidase family protein [Homoserinibacter sp. GY 40078]TXK18562.1 beta-galactosidase [Homoserinibacter sp. GY 40078]